MNSKNKKRAAGQRRVDADAAMHRFREYLAGSGLRLTGQRKLVLEAAFRTAGHFDAEELYGILRAGTGNVSLATVYRTVSHLQKCGLVREVMRNRGRAYYETAYGQAHHDHMVCLSCGKVIEFCDQRIEDLQERICRRHGFRALEHRMGIRGLCRECRSSGRESEDADDA
jgi:Fur family ferric uptake transcriptional regulator